MILINNKRNELFAQCVLSKMFYLWNVVEIC